MDKLKIANISRNFALIIGISIGVMAFIFALLSGSESYGGGLMGIIKNSPNALPWLLFLILIYMAWKWELLGGILINALGVFFLFFFVIFSHQFFLVPFILVLIILSIGSLFLLSWFLRKV